MPPPISLVDLAMKGQADLEAWLNQTDSKDALTALAVTQVALAQALGDFLQLIKDDTEATTARLKANNNDLETIRVFQRRLDSNKVTLLDETEAKKVNDIMKPLLGDKWTNINPGQQNSESIGSWLSSITANGDQISSDSQLNQSALNASTTRVSTAFDLVTSTIKKWSEIQGSTTGNIRV